MSFPSASRAVTTRSAPASIFAIRATSSTGRRSANVERRRTSMNSAGVSSGSTSNFIVLFLCFNINHHPVVDQIAFQVTARGIDELNAVASFATEIIDSCFIVNMPKRVNPRLNPFDHVTRQFLGTHMDRFLRAPVPRDVANALGWTVRDQQVGVTGDLGPVTVQFFTVLVVCPIKE